MKRQSEFAQGKPGEEYVELDVRPEDPPDPVKRATAAQLAARK
jgi:hypothetical protein